MDFCNLPDNIIELIFLYLSLRDVSVCMRLCRKFNTLLSDENSEVWRSLLFLKVSEKALKSDLLVSVPSYKAKLRAFYHSWNPLDCSRHVYIKPNAFTLHRNPVAQSTDGARSKIGFEIGRHIWEVTWEGTKINTLVIGCKLMNWHLNLPISILN